MNNDESFNNNILDRIRKEKLTPRSRWFFATERWFFIALVVLATVIGSIAVTTSIFILTDHDWFAVDYLQEGLFLHTIKTIPYLWLTVVALVIALVYFNIKKIGRGYRYEAHKVIVASLLLSMVLGAALFFGGAGAYLEHYFDHHIPSYQALVSSNADIWIYPEDGLLSGRITDAATDSFMLVDVDDQPWTVSIAPDTQVAKGVIAVGNHVKILGTMIDGADFSADMVLPWSNERK